MMRGFVTDLVGDCVMFLGVRKNGWSDNIAKFMHLRFEPRCLLGRWYCRSDRWIGDKSSPISTKNDTLMRRPGHTEESGNLTHLQADIEPHQ